MYKKCRICEKPKKLKEFHKKKTSKDGYRNECKECVKDVQKKYKEKPGFKEKQKEYDKKRYQENKDKILERKKEYYKENKEDILSYKELYRNDPKNKDRIKDYMDNYREEHREELRDYIRNNSDKNSIAQSNYRKNYPHIIAWRSLLHTTLKRLNTSKSSSTVDELGYSADELKEHIESQFKPGMTWDNHGEWHLDHIHPVTRFSSNTPVSEVCALDNLQPLWGEENLIKSNKLV